MEQNKEIYLGDGLYASFDGWQINLRAPRGKDDHFVRLEPEVFDSLVRFAREVNIKYDVEHFNLT